MKVNNPIHNRINNIISTGSCKKRDFIIPATKFEDYVFDLDMDTEAKNLLKTASKELSLSETKLVKLEKIAKGIQILEKSKITTACIIAEAISYIVE